MPDNDPQIDRNQEIERILSQSIWLLLALLLIFGIPALLLKAGVL